MFVRRLPDRSARNRVSYVCPTSATSLEAVSNFLLLASESANQSSTVDILVYEPMIAGSNRALIITTTADMGDLVIPFSYDQAMASKESEYWKAAIQCELNGLIELGTFEYVRLHDIPPDSNVMRCQHVIWSLQ